MFDFSEFFKAGSENGPIVLAVVVGLTSFAGDFGVSGKWQKLTALLIGLVFGGLFQVASLGTPGSLAEWFSVAIYGLLMGLTATKGYDTAKTLLNKAG